MTRIYYPRPETLVPSVMPQSGHVVIEASAGTGKTYTLEHLVLDFIITGRATVEEILVVTFTDAATRELRERVRKLIRGVCDATGPTTAPKNAASYWQVDDEARDRLRDALFRFDGAAISTIHGFCQRVLSEQAFHGGRLFEEEHANGSEMFGVAFREQIRETLADDGPVGEALGLWLLGGRNLGSLENLLYKCHREGCPDRCPVTPVWDPEGLVEAVRAVPSASDLKAAAADIDPGKQFFNNFGKHIDALLETLGRIEERPAPHAFIAAFLEWAGKTVQLKGIKGHRIDVLRDIAGRPEASDILREMARRLAEIEERAGTPSVYLVDSLLPRIQERLAARKRALGMLDYDDMLLGVRDALASGNKEARLLTETLRRRWSIALVDEFQDTDPVQWEIFRRLFVDGTEDHRLFVIGDPKQAIYGFRGADVHTYKVATRYLADVAGASRQRKKNRKIGSGDGCRVVLERSFRSSSALLDAVNEIFTFQDENGSSFFDGLNSYESPVKCGDSSLFAEQDEGPTAPVHLMHCYGEGNKLSAASLENGLACFIAREIQRLVSSNNRLVTHHGDREPRPLSFREIYILTRNAREGHSIGKVLRAFGIPHAFFKQEGLFQTPESENVHRLLCAIDNPADQSARAKAWLTPFFEVPLQDIEAWRRADEMQPLVADLLHWKSMSEEHAWSLLFEDVLTRSGILRRLIFEGDERALTNYLHIFEVLLAQAHTRPVTLSGLARDLKARIDGRKMSESREGDLQRLETEKDAVQILTMHKAKGLEAQVVFLGGRLGRPPNSNTSIYHHGNERRLHIGSTTGGIADAVAREGREEDQRLLYVAMTRAKLRLYLPYLGEVPSVGPEDGCYGYGYLGNMYKHLQGRLDAMRDAGFFDNTDNYVLREVCCPGRLPETEETAADLEDWPPEKHLLEWPESTAGFAERLEAGHRGVLLTSYTRMHRGEQWRAPASDSEDVTELQDDEAPTVVDEAFGEDEMPGGREVGILLHAMLEETAPAEVRNRSFEQWASKDEVSLWAASTVRRHGVGESYALDALRLVHAAFTAPVRVCSKEGSALLVMPEGISSGRRHVVEMAFVYPIPEASHPLLDSGGCIGDEPLPYEARRGYVQGLVDLLFEHEGKVYLLDWKSDRLPAFDKASLDAHITTNYDLQARVYSLAVIRMMGIGSEQEYDARFGGVLYSFVRGLQPKGDGSEGLWFSRPAWSEVVSWERDLLHRDEWGGKVMEGAL